MKNSDINISLQMSQSMNQLDPNLGFAKDSSAPDTRCQPINITFSQITYRVPVQKKVEGLALPCFREYQQKEILSDVSGVFKAGEVAALLGASGAGKTTLLNIIACRAEHPFQGSINVNGQAYSSDNFGEFANYVMQSDILMETLTVRETLQFAASLKVQGTQKEQKARVLQLAKSLKLEKCLDTKVGGNLIKGCSGGEKKRTSIAFQLMSDPQVIMLDEPTSGLDSLTSFIIVNYLRKLAHQGGRTVIMTIHQPNSEIFDMFDKLLLMAEGKLVYQGEASKAVDYFDTHFGLKCPEFTNPAQFVIHVLHPGIAGNIQRYPKYFEAYQRERKSSVLRQIEDVPVTKHHTRQNQSSICHSFPALLKRDITNIARNPILVKGRVFQILILSSFCGGLFFQAGKGDYTQYEDWRAISGFMFFMMMTTFLQAVNASCVTFPQQRQVFLKQQSAKLYSLTSYFISRNIVEIPFIFLFPLMFTLVVYWMVGLASTPDQFFIFYLNAVLMSFNGSSIGMFIGSIIKDAKTAMNVMIFVTHPLLLFSGFFKNRGTIAVWTGWFEYLSPCKYGFTVGLKNQVEDRASLINELNFNTGLWTTVGAVFFLALGYKLVAFFFLWLLKRSIH